MSRAKRPLFRNMRTTRKKKSTRTRTKKTRASTRRNAEGDDDDDDDDRGQHEAIGKRRCSWRRAGFSRGLLGASWGPLWFLLWASGVFLCCLGASWGSAGVFLGRLGAGGLLGRSRESCGAFLALLGPSW
eukprot:1084782-Pyramimonas_sp.AAC.1